MAGKEQVIWVLADDRAGNRAQALGVADALELPYVIKELTYGIMVHLPNFMVPPSFATLSGESRDQLQPPWPDLVIAAGRRTAGAARRIKKLSDGKARLVQIMYPGGAISDFNLIAVPSHDPHVGGSNIVRVTGAPHSLGEQDFEIARSQWFPRLSALPKPHIAVMVGGSTRRRQFGDAMGEELGRRASSMASSMGGSLLVTTSRRSGDAADKLISAISVPSAVYRWGQGGENPYLGYLASADAVIVTGDSVSMCSEACAVPVPVYIYAPEGLITPKHARFHELLFSGGYARPFGEDFTPWTHSRLNAADEVANAIKNHIL